MRRVRSWLSGRALVLSAVVLGTVLSVSAASRAEARCFVAGDCAICVILYQEESGQCNYTSWTCENGDSGTNIDCIVY